MRRRSALSALLAPFTSPWASAQQQTYPQPGRPIRLVLPFAAGSGTDVMSRAIVDDLNKALNTSFVVDNKPGANGVLATELVAKAPADGYTLLMGTMSAFSANPWLFKKLRYDTVKDFTPIARAVSFPCYLAVSGTSSITTLQEFLNVAKGGKLSLGYSNATGQVAGAHLMHAANFNAVSVAYKSTPQALVDLISGQVDFMFADVASAHTLVKDGRVRPIAMMSDTKSPLAPNLPPLGDTFPGFNYVAWAGLLGPAGLPDSVVAPLSRELVKTMRKPEIRDRLFSLGIEPLPGTSQEFGPYMVAQQATWGARIKEAGMQPE